MCLEKIVSFKAHTTKFQSVCLSAYLYVIIVALDSQKCLMSSAHTFILLALRGHKLRAALESCASWSTSGDGEGLIPEAA